MISIYQVVKTVAGVARYPLASRPVTALQRRLLDFDPTFSAQWRPSDRHADATISPRDEMYFGALRTYYSVGLCALRCIEAAVEAAGVSSIERALDMPCGHGRVLRFLTARFPQARFTACDLDRDGVSFCATTFGARGVVSRTDLEMLVLDDQFDLIWCGSLVTHLDQAGIESLMRFFHRQLRPGGLLVFSTHGEQAVENMRRGKLFGYGLPREVASAVLRSYEAVGFGYADYPKTPGYGVSFSEPAWIRKTLAPLGAWREVYFAKSGWSGHHDIFGFVREG